VTELSINKHIIKHADQANTIFPSLPNKNSVLFKTLKSDFLYMILLCLLVSSNLRSSPSSLTEKQFYSQMDKKQSKQNKTNMPLTLLGFSKIFKKKNPLHSTPSGKAESLPSQGEQ